MPASSYRARTPRSFPTSSVRSAVFRILSSFVLRALPVAGLAGAISTPAAAYLQCAPYARAASGIAIHGNAGTWWGQAAGHYARGAQPQVGAVLAFQPTRAMPIGHVAVVAAVIDSRHILLNHANWSGHGRIERGALAEDASANGDWSVVRVWYAPQHSLGLRTNPTFGFIYKGGSTAAAPAAAAPTDDFASIIAAGGSSRAAPAGTD
jgi:surface antigen